MTIYLLNTSIIPSNFCGVVGVSNITIRDVKKFIRDDDFVSVIGHLSTALFLTKILEIKIEVNRMNIVIKDDDIIIAFQLEERLEEGKIFSADELKHLKYSFKKMSFHELNLRYCPICGCNRNH